MSGPETELVARLHSGEVVHTHLGWLRVHRGRLERALVDLGNQPDDIRATSAVAATAWVETHITATDLFAAARRMEK